tara:strand:- start:164 stop:541 length:378 start_codon:yes stop_codon:yes gene_type:complete
MKNSILLSTTAAILLSATPSYSSWRHIDQTKCFQTREEYVPGRFRDDGRWLRGYVVIDQFEVPCKDGGTVYHHPTPDRTPECDPSKTAIGAMGGGALGAGLSRGDGRWWAIPLGAFFGAKTYGCD